MRIRAIKGKAPWSAVGVAVALALVLALAQLLLPAIAARRVRDRVKRYGTVHSASVRAWPAVQLLWGKADAATVRTGSLSISPAQIVGLLWEARGVRDVNAAAGTVDLQVRVLAAGLVLHDVTLSKRGSAVDAQASLTQSDLRAALPPGFQLQPIASGAGEVQVRASGGLFGVQASVNALIGAQNGKLVAQPQGLPATIVLFSDPHLYVQGIGLSLMPGQPVSWRLTLRASLR